MIVYSTDADTEINQYFELDRNTGEISLKRQIGTNMENFNLTIEVTDDGSCCPTHRRAIHTTTGFVVVEFIGVNHQPQFPECVDYDPQILEGSPIGTSVLNVSCCY